MPGTITNADIIQTIVNSTQEVFSMMLGLEVNAGEAFVGASAGTESGVLALLGFAGDWSGTGSLSCSAALACRIASQMLMAEYEGVNDEVLDAVAEVANMILGSVKTHLETTLGSMALSTPTAIYGRHFETRRVGSQEWVTVPFPCEGETIRVQLCLAPARDRSAVFHPGFSLPHTMQI
jgi:chemotaxis protein CheX